MGDNEFNRRGVRAVGATVVTLVAVAAGTVTSDLRAVALTVTVAALVAVAAVWWRRHGAASPVARSAAVAAALVAAVLLEHLLTGVGALLWAAGIGLVAAGAVLDERRLTAAGVVSLAVELARPGPQAATFSHCLVAPQLAVPALRLTGPLVLALVAVAVGTVGRRRAVRRDAARGLEAAGAVTLTVVLLARAVELPGHRLLCGPGDAVDEGWVVTGLAVAAASVLYGLAGRDGLWAGIGLAGWAAQAATASLLAGAPWWALAGATPLAAALLAADRRGVAWPDAPGYGVAAPDLAALRSALALPPASSVPPGT